MTSKAPPNVLFGHDVYRTYAELPDNADIGNFCYVTDNGQWMVFDGTLWLPVGMLRFVYDPGGHVKATADSGAIGTVGLGVTLPAKALILDGILDITTGFVGAGASLALQAESAGDLLATTAVASLTAGLKDVVPVGTAATAKVTTAQRTLSAVVSGAAFTDGTVQGFLRWMPLH